MSAATRLLLLIIFVALTCATARAQQDLDANKSGAQLFASDCADCHRSPRGLAKDGFSWTLWHFLQQHYTSSPASAQTLTAYLQSVDAAGTKPRPATALIEVPKMMSGLMSWASKVRIATKWAEPRVRRPRASPKGRKPQPTQTSAPLPPPRPTGAQREPDMPRIEATVSATAMPGPRRGARRDAPHVPVVRIPD